MGRTAKSMLNIYCHTYHYTPFEFCELYLVLCVTANVPRSFQYHQKGLVCTAYLHTLSQYTHTNPQHPSASSNCVQFKTAMAWSLSKMTVKRKWERERETWREQQFSSTSLASRAIHVTVSFTLDSKNIYEGTHRREKSQRSFFNISNVSPRQQWH